MPNALIVEDEPRTRDALATLVELEGFDVRVAGSLAEARPMLDGRPDVVLTDLGLPDGSGTELLETLREQSDVEVIVITGEASIQTAVEALRLGAYDYLTKPIDEARLTTLLAGVARTRDLKGEISDLRQELRRLGRFGHMVGTSDVMQAMYDMIERVAPTDAGVFLIGESGTGKEVVAETVHQLSRRRKAPFVAVNCGAVASNLIESELFGHEKGSFTGAEHQHIGLFERADGGTLFLDEVTETPLELQVKLLRVLESRKVQRVGGRAPIDVDVRIVAATNRDPDQAVADGKLRSDLLYRLKIFPISLPPLRHRHGDVELLAQSFLEQQNRDAETHKRFTAETLEALARHAWPGNVRELKNVVQRTFIMADDTLTPNCLPPEILGSHTPSPSITGGLELRVGMTVAEAERRLVEATLQELDGDKKRAAAMLGISLKTLYNRLNAWAESSSA